MSTDKHDDDGDDGNYQRLVRSKTAAFRAICRATAPAFPFRSSHRLNRSVGVHALVNKIFGDPAFTERSRILNQRKRTRHTRYRGVRMHACIQHHAFCKHTDISENSAEENMQSAGEGGNVRTRYLRKRAARKCAQCDHPSKCRISHCSAFGARMRVWLSAHALVPVAVEHDVEWPRLGARTRVDMICTREDDVDELSSLVVVSLKTLGNDEDPPTYCNHGKDVVSLPYHVFQRAVPDCERTRHQLQLMVECLILADAYAMVPTGAHVVYVNDSDAGAVNSQKADMWWFTPLFASAKQLKLRSETISHIIRRIY